MKKLLIGVLSLAFVSCVATAMSVKNVTAGAQEVMTSDIFTETKCQISKSGDKMLIVTGITDVTNIYEIGYDISGGYVVGENDKAVTNKYYESLTLGTETRTAGEFIAGAEGLLIWEIAYDSNYTYTVQPYAYVGERNDEGQLIAPEGNEKTYGAIKSNLNMLSVSYETYEGVTYNGEDTVNKGDAYTFSVSVNEEMYESGYTVLVNGEEVTAVDGVYTVDKVQKNLSVSITGLTKKSVYVSSGRGTVENNVYQAHAEAGLDGVMGAKFVSLETQTTFGFGSTINLNAGENLIAKFLTTNDIMPAGQGKYEVNYVTYHLTDTVTGNKLSISVRSYPFVEGAPIDAPNAWVAVFYNNALITLQMDGYGSNFSNVTKNDTAWRYIPQVYLDTTTGAVSYCGVNMATNDAFVGFGVENELSVSVELNVKETGYGIVLDTLCNKKLATVAVVEKDESEAYTITGADTVNLGETYTFSVSVNEELYEGEYTVMVNGEAVVATDGIYSVDNVQEDLFITVTGLTKKKTFTVSSGSGTVNNNVYQAHAEAGLDGVMGMELIATGETATFTYSSTANLISGENLIAKFMTTNDIMPAGQGNYEVNYVTFHLTDTVTGNKISISVRSYYFVDNIKAPNAYVAIFYNDGFLDLKMDGYASNFSNETKNDTAWRFIPQVYLDTTTGWISYCGVNICNNGAFVGFGVGNEVAVSVELNLKESGNGVVIDTLCNEKLATAKIVTKTESEAYTITGADTVNKGETYTFSVSVNEMYEGEYTVLVNGEAVVATDGVYTVANVQEDLFITVEGLVKKISFSVTSGNGTVEKNASQAHAEAGLDGVTGTKLTSTDTTSVFTYDSTMNLIAGENVLAKFMTTNEIMVNKGNFEVDGVKFNFTDGNGNTLTIWIRSYAYTEGGGAYDAEISNPQASVTIFYNGSLLAVTYPAGYLDNFSNVTRDTGWAFLMIPEIGLNTTTGTISYCGAAIGTYDYLAGFGVTSELTVSVQLDLHVTGYGIVIDTLCNEKLASVAVAKE